MSDGTVRYTIDGKVTTLRRGQEMVAVNPFTPEEEWITAEEFARRRQQMTPEHIAAEPRAPRLVITKIDHKNKTVTFDTETEE